MISDNKAEILKEYNLIYQVPEDLARKYKEEYQIDLEAASGRKDHVIAVPATFIIDTTGTIIFADVNEDYKVRTTPDEIFAELELLNERSKGIQFTPIKHATLTIQSNSFTIFVDPVGEESAFASFPEPDVILITDVHYDHLDVELVKKLRNDKTLIFVPPEAMAQLGAGQVIKNGERKTYENFQVEAIPMYNLTPDRLKFHEKGRGNGYVLTLNGKKIYLSGDTEDIPEMRALRDIDYAFICMNLPYTMTVNQAVSAVLDFKPRVVFPYHYRGTDGLSDVNKFKDLVTKQSDIDVRLLNWY